MSSCEKCWSDAHSGYPYCDVAGNYRRLIEERRASPCTPEEQAGPDATECPKCKTRTCHQYTGQCMNYSCDHGVPRSARTNPTEVNDGSE